MISKEVLLDRINAHNLPVQQLTVKVEGALYHLLSKEEKLIRAIQEQIGEIIPEPCNLFYLSNTTYSPPTQQYLVSFMVR